MRAIIRSVIVFLLLSQKGVSKREGGQNKAHCRLYSHTRIHNAMLRCEQSRTQVFSAVKIMQPKALCWYCEQSLGQGAVGENYYTNDPIHLAANGTFWESPVYACHLIMPPTVDLLTCNMKGFADRAAKSSSMMDIMPGSTEDIQMLNKHLAIQSVHSQLTVAILQEQSNREWRQTILQTGSQLAVHLHMQFEGGGQDSEDL